jgi:hypothetical protein
VINVYDSYLLVRTPVQGDMDGTILAFSNGYASAAMGTGGVMTLGGAIVSSTAATRLSPVLK